MQKEVIKDLNLGWVPIYKEMSVKLMDYKNDRKSLVNMLYDSFKNDGLNTAPLMDQNPAGIEIPLDDICPFTIFNLLNRQMTGENRDNMLKSYMDFFGLKQSKFNFSDLKDTANDTIPLTRPIKVWFFPFKFERNPDDIDKLWDMFEAAINYADSNGIGREEFIKAYDDCIKVKWNGPPKLSQTLYSLRPQSFPTLEGNSVGYLLDLIGNESIHNSILKNTIANKKKYNGEEYLDIASALKDEFTDTYGKNNVFIGLSYDAYSRDIPPIPVPPTPSPIKPNETKRENNMKHPLNQILYGPPGTGKTYATKELAVRIAAADETVDQINKKYGENKRQAIKKEYDRLCSEKRIEFITFHQSYGYEEFVEGIKPKLLGENSIDVDKGKEISYHIQEGVFQRICFRAAGNSEDRILAEIDAHDYKDSKVWVMRLGDARKYNDECFENDYILMGWGSKDDLSKDGRYEKLKEEGDESIRSKNGRLEDFYENMKPNDLIIVPSDTKNALAIGIVGKYRFAPDRADDYKHMRYVHWLSKKDTLVFDINQGVSLAAQGTLYDNTHMRPEDLIIRVKENNNSKRYETKPYILIIDEINRGNISKILGELITLLEDDKRLGRNEELKVTLPYSRKSFGVPSNLYIIGTMNTADRSIAFLDTALRRRFKFIKMMPDTSLLYEDMSGINLQELLKVINERITEHLDRDHQIGHSYFMGDRATTIDALANTFRNNICPLLDEYFYDRRESIPVILNNSALINKKNNDWEWAEESKKNDAFMQPENYKKIYADN